MISKDKQLDLHMLETRFKNLYMMAEHVKSLILEPERALEMI